MHATLQALSIWLEAHRPRMARSLRPGCDHDQLAAVGEALGVMLSAPLRSLWRWHDGQEDAPTAGMLVFNLSLMTTAEVVQTATMMQSMWAAHPQWWGAQWVPILQNGGGDYICVDLRGDTPGAHARSPGSRGQLVQFWHDSPRRTLLAPDLETFLRALLDSWQRDPWRDGDTGYQPRDQVAWDRHKATLQEHMPGYPIHWEVRAPR